jgi:hypothetical protein
MFEAMVDIRSFNFWQAIWAAFKRRKYASHDNSLKLT